MLVNIPRRLLFVFLFFLISSNIVFGQNNEHANVWYFGYNAGIDFTGGPPRELKGGQMQQREGCSSISDGNGMLLLYTDGIRIWNGRHQVISEGFDMGGNVTSTQSAIIVPKPSNPNIYYIFTTFTELSCITVDINLNAGMGGVVSKQILLKNSTEKLAAVKHCNNEDFWVLAHEKGNNIFKSFLVTRDGIEPATENSIGLSYDLGTSVGHLKFSPGANRLAAALFNEGAFQLFDFDNSTGVISNPIILRDEDFNQAYGLEFSPDGYYLYVTGTLEKAVNIFQMEINNSDQNKILGSKVQVGHTSESYFGALQLGPGNKIYVAKNDTKSLGVINNPNVKGKNCNYDNEGFKLSSGSSGMGLPNFIASFFESETASKINCKAKVYIPDIFTPNQDGINDTFKILFGEGKAIRLDIFDRWGTCIYTDYKSEPEWDGKVNGERCPIGTYAFVLTYVNEKGHRYVRRGAVMLLE